MDFNTRSLLNFDFVDTDKARLDNMTLPELVNKIYVNKLTKRMLDGSIEEMKQTEEYKNVSPKRIKMEAIGEFLVYLAGSSEKLQELNQKIASPKKDLSQYERQVLEITLDALTQYPESMAAYFDHYGLFAGLLFKGEEGAVLLSRINQIQKNTPESCLFLAIKALKEQKDRYVGYEDSLLHYMDTYLDIHFAQTSPAKILKKCPEYASALLYYLKNASPHEAKAAHTLFQKCDTLPTDLQTDMWQELFQNASTEKLRSVIHGFLSNRRTPEANRIFYHQFIKGIPVAVRQNILALATDKQKINYLKLLQEQKIDLDKVEIQDPTKKNREFLLWHLLDKGHIVPQDMNDIIQKGLHKKQTQPSKQTFLFQDKTAINPEIFMQGCRAMAASPFNTLRWLASFRRVENFPSWLAIKWLELPETIRQNANIILALDNKFGLLHRLAERGDTGVLNTLKSVLEKKELQKRLQVSDEKGNTIIHILCSQGKKGVLKLIESLPPQEQSLLLNIKNNAGQTPLDCCSADFRRFMEQKSFVRPKQEKTEERVIVAPEMIPEEKTAPKKTPVHIWRSLVTTQKFQSDKKTFQTNPRVLEAMENEIKKLRSMDPVSLQLRMKKDLKPRVKNKPCVADFTANGSFYRMGYIVDKNTVGLLFVMIHGQYDKELQNTRYMPNLVKLCRRLIAEKQ